MANSSQHRNWILGIGLRAATSALAFPIGPITAVAVVIIMVLALLGLPPAQAQTFTVIHSFSGAGDGANPEGRLAMDHAGNLYGTANYGGAGQYGTVFKLSHRSSDWTLSPLFSFSGDNNGGQPQNGVVFGPDGSLYGTTYYTVFNLAPQPTRPASVLSPWKINTLYEFQQMSDGFEPFGDLVFDSGGNIFGVTALGGQGCYEGCGEVYELVPSGGGWLKKTLYEFSGSDGEFPLGLLFDSAGNLDGITYEGGANGEGVIFQLSPSGNNWMESILYNFDSPGNGGFLPEVGLISDAAGNLYGATSEGPGNSGVIFELSPSNGGWTYTVLAQIPSKYEGGPAIAPLTMDAAGNLYGTINGYCQECPGAVFKLTHGSGGWTFTSLHDFTNGSDGGHPYSNVAIDADGNLYGTASVGGTGGKCGNGCGVVWKISP